MRISIIRLPLSHRNLGNWFYCDIIRLQIKSLLPVKSPNIQAEASAKWAHEANAPHNEIFVAKVSR